jgi:hypothetical protein
LLRLLTSIIKTTKNSWEKTTANLSDARACSRSTMLKRACIVLA